MVHNRQCNVCNKEFTNQTWKAVVQVRIENSPDDARSTKLVRLIRAPMHGSRVRRVLVASTCFSVCSYVTQEGDFVSLTGSMICRRRDHHSLIS